MVISVHKFFATTSINMRTAVVYIKTQRWMFNQSCMNIFGLPHRRGERVFCFICVWSMHKTSSDFEWRFGQNQSVNFLTSQNEKSSRPNDSRHLYFLCFIYLELEIFTSKVRKFFRCFVRIWQLLFRKVIQ